MLGVFERTKQFMKPKIKPAEWAILCAVPTGVCAGYFVSDNRVLQAITIGLVTGFIVMSWEMVALHREVQKLRETISKSKV
jgi:hypothetical protein